MKADFKIISSILIAVLTVLLAVVLISYYRKPLKINTDILNDPTLTNRSEIVNNIGQEHKNDLVSGEQIIENINQSGENSSGEKIDDNSHIISPSDKPRNDDKTVIITSDDTMTNKEKRQILTELDTTLMELLEAVDKVQTVDETRLVNKEESGVQ